VKEIPLSRGLVALVDDEDFDALNAFRWHAITAGKNSSYYAARRERGGKRVLLMHREILKPEDESLKVDHIDGDRLNNRRCNLRLATQGQNKANTRKSWAKSGFKGVYPLRGLFKVMVAGKYVCYCKTAEEAAMAYDAAALAKWGEFAATNKALGLLP
jgi:hypothetical protein